MADWSDIIFTAGQTDYIARLNTLRTRAEANTSEVEAARGAEASLTAQVATRLTQAQVDARITALSLLLTGLTVNLNGNGYRINAIADPLDPQDAATKAWTLAQITLGGDPSGIPVTSLAVGTLTDNQLLQRSGAGLAGVSASALAVTGFGVGTLADGEVLIRSGAALVGLKQSDDELYFYASF